MDRGEETFFVSLLGDDSGGWACLCCGTKTAAGWLLCETCLRDPETRKNALPLRNEWGAKQLQEQRRRQEERKSAHERSTTENAVRRERDKADCAARIRAMPNVRIQAKCEIGANGCPRCLAKNIHKTNSYSIGTLAEDAAAGGCDIDINYIDPRLRCNRCLPNSE